MTERLGSLYESLGVVGVLIGLVVQIFINAGVMWLVVNHILSKEKVGGSFKTCLIAVILLLVVSVLAIACFFIPLPCVVNLLLAMSVWYFGSVAVIEGMFEMTGGGLTVLIFYLMTSVGIGFLLDALV